MWGGGSAKQGKVCARAYLPISSHVAASWKNLAASQGATESLLWGLAVLWAKL